MFPNISKSTLHLLTLVQCTVCIINCHFKLVSLNEARGGVWRGRRPEAVLAKAAFARGSDRPAAAHCKIRMPWPHWCHLRNLLVFTGHGVAKSITLSLRQTKTRALNCFLLSSFQCFWTQTVSSFPTSSLNVSYRKRSKTLSLDYSTLMTVLL